MKRTERRRAYRAPAAVDRLRLEDGLKAPNWSPAEDAFLREHYATRNAEWCAEHLPGRTWQGVRSRASLLGLRHTNLIRNGKVVGTGERARSHACDQKRALEVVRRLGPLLALELALPRRRIAA